MGPVSSDSNRFVVLVAVPRPTTSPEANGQSRLAANLRQAQTNLEKIIPALEAIGADAQETGHDPS